MKILSLIVALFHLELSYASGLSCFRQLAQTQFQIEFFGEEVSISDPMLRDYECLAQQNDELLFEIVCENQGHLIAILHNQDGEGAMVSNQTGIIDLISCRQN